MCAMVGVLWVSSPLSPEPVLPARSGKKIRIGVWWEDGGTEGCIFKGVDVGELFGVPHTCNPALRKLSQEDHRELEATCTI